MARFNSILVLWHDATKNTADIFVGETKIGVVGKLDQAAYPDKKPWAIAGIAFDLAGCPPCPKDEISPVDTYASWQDAIQGLFNWHFSDGLVFLEFEVRRSGEVILMEGSNEEYASNDYLV